MNFQKGKLEIDIAHAVLYGCTTMIGLNIVSRKMLHFASFATCSKTQITSQRVLLHLLWKAGEIGI